MACRQQVKLSKNLTEHASRKELQDAELLYQQLKVEMADILEPVARPLEIDSTKKTLCDFNGGRKWRG